MNGEKALKMIRILLAKEDYITIHELSVKMEVSEKTVRNYLNKIPMMIEGLRLLKVPGQGIRINADSEVRMVLSEQVNVRYGHVDLTDRKGRYLYLLFLLLVEEKTIDMRMIEEKMFISRPSIYKDLKVVEEWLAVQEIELVRERCQGFHIECGEKRKRIATFAWLVEAEHYMNDLKMNHIDIYVFEEAFSFIELMKHSPFYGTKVCNILREIETIRQVRYTPSEFERLNLMLCIAIRRISENHIVSLSDKIYKSIHDKDEGNFVNLLMSKLSRTFLMDFPMSEVLYLTALILTAKTTSNNEKKIRTSSYELERSIAHEIALYVYEHYYIKHKQAFEDGLTSHLQNTLQKIMYGKDFYNPMKDSIVEAFPEFCKLNTGIIEIINKYCNFEIPEDEVAYFILQTASAVEVSKSSIRAIFVYNEYYNEAKYTCEYLIKNFKQIEILNILSNVDLPYVDLSEIDLVFTNYQIKEKNEIPVIVVPVLINHAYIAELAYKITFVYEEVNRKRLSLK